MTLLQDLRYALRGFSRNRGVTVAAVVSLAIGIGANTSIFSVASALLLSPLRYQDAERLVTRTATRASSSSRSLSVPTTTSPATVSRSASA